MKKLFFILLLFLNSTFCICQSIAIKAGKLFDARSGTVLENQIILIENGVIANVMPDKGQEWKGFKIFICK